MSRYPALIKKKNKERTFLPYIACLLTLFLFAGCLTASNSIAEDSKPLIRVGSEVEFPPFALLDEDGKPTGFSVDLIKAIADSAGLSIVFETGDWDKMWNGLVSGKFDVLPIVAKSNERLRVVDFGLPHTETFDAFFVREGNPKIGSIDAAQGKKIVVMRSDAAHHELLGRNFQGELVLVDTIPEGLSMVAGGKGDAFLCSKLIGALAIKKHGIQGLTAGPLIPDYKRVFSLGVRKGDDELREKLNQGLLLVKASGQYDRIYEKWLTIDDPWLKYRKYLLPAFLVLAALTVLTLLGLTILRTLVKKRTAELATTNRELEKEIVARKCVEEELVSHKQRLEVRIEERTRELRESEERFKTIFNEAPLGIALIDSLTGHIYEVNPMFARIAGRTVEQMANIDWMSIIHPDDVQEDLDNMALLNAGKIPGFQMEQRYLDLDGTAVWINMTISPLKVPDEAQPRHLCMIENITDRKRAELERSEIQKRLEIALENGVIGVWDWRINTGELYQDKHWLRQLGYSEGEVETNIESWSDRIHPDDKPHVMDVLNGYLSGDLPTYETEHRLRTKSGEWKWIFTSGKILEYDDFGAPVRMLGNHFDIHDRKLSAEIIRESERKHRLLIENLPAGVVVHGANTEILLCNHLAARLLGVQYDRMSGKTALDDAWCFFREDGSPLPVHEYPVNRVIATLQPVSNVVLGIEQPDTKNRIWVLVNAYPTLTLENGVHEIMVTFVDITDRVQADQARREIEERYRAVVDNLHVGISVLNREMEIVAINPFFKAYYPEVRPGTGQTCYAAYNDPPQSSPCSYCPSLLTFQDGEVHESETETPAGGKIRNYRIVSSPVKDDKGEVQLVIELVEDVTEKKSLQAQLLQSQKMEAVGTLAAGIAHDFNNMLQAILGYSDLLLDGKTRGEPGYQELERIVETSLEARDLVQKIRLFSRKADLQSVSVDLNHQLIELTKLLSHTFLKTINLDLHLAENLAIISADPALMDQMVTNLAINASEAMPDGGRLTIETQNILLDEDFCSSHIGTKPGPHVLLTISDSGRGMSEEIINRIFDPFFSTKQRDYHRGTGLGLSIVKGIVDEHNGYITVDSEVGKGTTFKIYFPILTIQPKPHVQAEAKIEVTTEPGETILLVEDEEFVRELGTRLLERFGYKVIAVCDGQEAIEVYAKEKENISLVILDIVMPRMDGRECLQELLKINPAVKVLISSGVAQDDRVKEVVDLGARGALLKPYSMKSLQEKVREVIDCD